MNEAERVQRAHLAKQSLEFLEDAFGVVSAEYFARLQTLCASRPWATNEIAALANATRIVSEVRGQIEGLVADGVDAKAKLDRAAKIEAMSPAKKRLLSIGNY